MAYSLLEPQAAEQMDRCVEAHDQWRAAQASLSVLASDMKWVTCPDGDHLHRVSAKTGEMLGDLGLKTAALTAIHDRHADRQREARRSSEDAVARLAEVARDNVAMGTARVPNIVIRIIEVLWSQGLMDFYRVIGTHALYAYEAAARVTFDAPTMATNDVDLLWDVQKRVKFFELMRKADLSMIDVLKMADPTFERNEENKESAINDTTFSVDFLRRPKPEPEPDAFPISGKEGDVFPVKAPRAELFLQASVFEQAVVGLDGRITCMRTINPKTFVDFKMWMSDQPDREFRKRRRDAAQAGAVQQLIDEGRLQA